MPKAIKKSKEPKKRCRRPFNHNDVVVTLSNGDQIQGELCNKDDSTITMLIGRSRKEIPWTAIKCITWQVEEKNSRAPKKETTHV